MSYQGNQPYANASGQFFPLGQGDERYGRLGEENTWGKHQKLSRGIEFDDAYQGSATDYGDHNNARFIANAANYRNIKSLTSSSSGPSVLEGAWAGSLVFASQGNDPSEGFQFITRSHATANTDYGVLLCDLSRTKFEYKGYAVWHEGNMGPDSGMDADSVDGSHLADIIKRMVETYGSTLQDPNVVTDPLILTKHVNTPDAGQSWWYIETTIYHNNDSRRMQVATQYDNEARRFYRRLTENSGIWEPWIRLLDSQQVQKSRDDRTSGAVLVQGAHGLGETGIQSPVRDGTTAFVPYSGFQYVYNSASNTPPGWPGGAVLSLLDRGWLGFSATSHRVFAANPSKQWFELWSSSRQGPGTGMDADTVDGAHLEGILKRMVETHGSTLQDPNTATDPLILTNHENTPDSGEFWYVETVRFTGSGGQPRRQVATRYRNGNARYYRTMFSSAWGPWIRLLDSQQVQASPTDTTAGALMAVGAFGLGNPIILASGSDLNAVTDPGFYHAVTAALNKPGGNGYLIVNRLASNYVYQQYTENSNVGGSFVRICINGTWTDWQKTWNAANDGPGSGMDADTVDGIEGARIVVKDVSGQTLRAPLKLAGTNEGASNTAFLEFIGSSGTRIGYVGDGTVNNTNITLRSDQGRVEVSDSSGTGYAWHAGNDGPDSGMDADTIDGAHLSGIIKRMVETFGNTTQDPNLTTDHLIVTRHENTPTSGEYWWVETTMYHGNTGSRMQVATKYEHTRQRYYRTKHFTNGGTWGPWIRLLDSQQVQNSAIDTTPGALMTVGAFGLGADNLSPIYRANTDIDSLTEGGVAYVTNGAPNRPPGWGGGYIVTLPNRIQIAYEYRGSDVWVRQNPGSDQAGSDWHKFWTSAAQGPGTGMDSDLLDGQHGDYYRKAINFLDTRDHVDVPTDFSKDLRAEFKRTSSVGLPPVKAPSDSSYAHVLSVSGWDNGSRSGGYVTQLSVGEGISFRRATSPTEWGAWRTFWHDGNDAPLRNASNLDAGTVPKARLSGTYDIDVTGNAATSSRASEADNADALGGIEAAAYRLKADHILATNAHAHADQIDAYPVGASVMYVRSADGWPSQAGTVLTVRPDEANAGYQEYTNGTGDSGESRHFQMTRIYYASVGVWGAWRYIITGGDRASTSEYGVVRRSTDSDARAGVGGSDYVTPNQLPVHKSIVHTLSTNTFRASWYHYGVRAPDLAWARLRCNSPEHGYKAGQYVDNLTIYDRNSNNRNQSLAVSSDADYCYVLMGDGNIYIPRDDRSPADDYTGDYVVADRAKWSVEIHAVWYP